MLFVHKLLDMIIVHEANLWVVPIHAEKQTIEQ